VGERKNGKGERRNGRWSEGGRKTRKMRKAVGNGKTRVIHRSAVGMGIPMGMGIEIPSPQQPWTLPWVWESPWVWG